MTKNNIKTGKSNLSREALSTRLAAYSATAGAALLAIPGTVTTAYAGGGIEKITTVSVTSISIPRSSGSAFAGQVTVPFTAGQFHGSMLGLNVSYHGGGSTELGGSAGIKGNIARSAGIGFHAAQPAKGAAFAGLSFNGSGVHALAVDKEPSGVNGQFQGAHKTGYLAFKTGNYYGWLKAQVQFSTGPRQWADKLTLLSNGTGVFGAFDKRSTTAADDFTVGNLTATPEPSSLALGGLGLLAMGASGIRELRRRRAAKTA